MKVRFVVIPFLLALCSSSAINAQVKKKRTPAKPITKNPIVAATPTGPLTAREIANKILPSTLMIITQNEKGEPVAQGSGFVYKPGLIATNLHVFNRATKGFVKFIGKDETYKIEEVVGINKRRDLCVVRINENQSKPLVISNSVKTEVGEDVYVASNPKGLEGSFSKGIVSAVRTNIGLLQIDAAISPGSSGSAVVNSKGEVIGMVVSTVTTGQNLNFVIPIDFLTSLTLLFREPITSAGALAFNDRQRKQVRGFVESISETQSKFVYDKDSATYRETDPKISEKISFDVYGDVIVSFHYYDGIIYAKRERKYDLDGFLRVIHNENYPSPLLSDLSETKTFHTEYSVTESIKFANERRNFSQVSDDGIVNEVYDKDGRLLEITVYKPNSTQPMSSLKYSYDKNGQVSERASYEFGVLDSITRNSYEYDERGNWIKKKSIILLSEYQDLGFTPDNITYRAITYFSD